jgi:hypothetical protein
MNEMSFSRWLCKHFTEKGLFPQRLEVTTGAGVPDIALLGVLDGDPYMGRLHTEWLELKWNTKHIRPEQYVWGTKARNAGINVNYIVGYEDRMELYFLSNAKKMAKSFKLTELEETYSRTKEGVVEMIQDFY